MTEEVQVWVATLDVSDDRYDALARVLAAEEKERAVTLTPVAARRFVVARGILRSLLAGIPPGQKPGEDQNGQRNQ